MEQKYQRVGTHGISIRHNPSERSKASTAGITLIALVVTIVILIILAGIGLTALNGNNGLINKAGKAKEDAETAEEKEIIEVSAVQAMVMNKYGNIDEEQLRTIINKSITADVKAEGSNFIVKTEKRNYLVNGSGEVNKITWFREQQEDGSKTITNGDVTLKIGDYIDYDANSNGEITYEATSDKTGITDEQVFSTSYNTGGWRLLDVYYADDGDHLVIIPNNVIKSTENEGLKLKEATGYQYGVDEIKNISQIYGKGKNASYARAIELEDLNTITGYNPLKTGNGEKYGENTVDEYNSKITVTSQANLGPYIVSSDNGAEYTETYASFIYWDESTNTFKRLAANKQISLINNYYKYFITTLTDNSSDEQKGLSTSDITYKILFQNKIFWIASKFGYNKYYGIYSYRQNFIGIGDAVDYLKSYGANTPTGNKYIQPMVYLDTDINLEINGKKNNVDFWEIK